MTADDGPERSDARAAELPRPRRGPRRRASAIVEALDETLFVEAGAGIGQDQGARRPRRRAGDPSRRAHARDRRHHLHREGGGRAARPDPARARGRGPRRRGGRRGPGRTRARGARRRRGLHAARVRAAAPDRAPDRSRAPAADRGARRHRVAARVRGALDALRRRAARRPRDRAHAAPRAQRRHHPHRPPHAGAGVQRELGPRRRAHGTRARPAAARRCPRAGARRARPSCTSSPGTAGRPTTSCWYCSANLATWHERAPRRARRVRAAAPPHRGHAEGERQPGPQGQLAQRVPGGVGARPGEGAPAAGRRDRGEARRGRPAAPGVGARTVHAARGRGAPPPRAAGVPRPAGAGPSGAARPGARVGRPAATAGAVHAPAARRVPGHRSRSRSTSPRCWHRARPTRAADRWDELPVDPGRLFVVGDPKQSIYRFRRADIAAFLRARSAFGAAPLPPHAELPHRPPGHRLRQRGVPRPHRRGAGVATRVRGARTPCARPRRSGHRSCSSARPHELEKPTADELREREARGRRRGHRACAARGLAGLAAGHRRDRAVRAVSTRRHLRAAPGAHLARPARGRARRRRHPVPGRDVVAGLQHAARSATCSSCCRRSTTPPTSSRS